MNDFVQLTARIVGLMTVYTAAATMLFAAAYDFWRAPSRWMIT